MQLRLNVTAFSNNLSNNQMSEDNCSFGGRRNGQLLFEKLPGIRCIMYVNVKCIISPFLKHASLEVKKLKGKQYY